MNKKLRLGLLIDTLEIPVWFYRSLERIVKAETAEFILFILNLDPSQNVTHTTISRRSNHFLYDLLSQVDEKLFVRTQSASETRNIRDIFINPEMLGVKPKTIEGSSEITTEDVQKIREYHLDILFQLGFYNLCGEIYRSAKFGIWSISYNASQVLRGDPTGYWEVVENIPQTSAILKMKTSDLSLYKILYCSHYFTYPFSPARNKNELYWSASSILPRQMEALVRMGELDFFKAIQEKYPEMENHTSKEIHLPSNRQVISHTFSLVSKIIH